MAQINASQLYQLLTTFLNDIDFEAPKLIQFISRTPKIRPYDKACFVYCNRKVLLSLHQSHPEPSGHRMIEVEILSDWRLSSLVKICTLSLCLLLSIENLYIYKDPFLPLIWSDIQNIEWLGLLVPFKAVKNLHLSKIFLPCIVLALKELT